jgi:hypothetical protein
MYLNKNKLTDEQMDDKPHRSCPTASTLIVIELYNNNYYYYYYYYYCYI